MGTPVKVAVKTYIHLAAALDQIRAVTRGTVPAVRREMDHQNMRELMLGIRLVNAVETDLKTLDLPVMDLDVFCRDTVILESFPTACTGNNSFTAYICVGLKESDRIEPLAREYLVHLRDRAPPVIMIASRGNLLSRKRIYEFEVFIRLLKICRPRQITGKKIQVILPYD